MNSNPVTATKWKGRILFCIEVKEVDKPQFLCIDLKPPSQVEREEATKALEQQKTKRLMKDRMTEFIEENDSQDIDSTDSEEDVDPRHVLDIAPEFTEKIGWNVIWEVNQCINTPKGETPYSVQFVIGEHVLETKKDKDFVNPGVNYVRWSMQRSDIVQLMLPYTQLDDFDEIFIYLCEGSKRVSYAKFRATNFEETSPSLQWIELKPEPITGVVTSPEKAGVLGFRATIVRAD